LDTWQDAQIKFLRARVSIRFHALYSQPQNKTVTRDPDTGAAGSQVN